MNRVWNALTDPRSGVVAVVSIMVILVSYVLVTGGQRQDRAVRAAEDASVAVGRYAAEVDALSEQLRQLDAKPVVVSPVTTTTIPRAARSTNTTSTSTTAAPTTISSSSTTSTTQPRRCIVAGVGCTG